MIGYSIFEGGDLASWNAECFKGFVINLARFSEYDPETGSVKMILASPFPIDKLCKKVGEKDWSPLPNEKFSGAYNR